MSWLACTNTATLSAIVYIEWSSPVPLKVAYVTYMHIYINQPIYYILVSFYFFIIIEVELVQVGKLNLPYSQLYIVFLSWLFSFMNEWWVWILLNIFQIEERTGAECLKLKWLHSEVYSKKDTSKLICPLRMDLN